MRHPKAKSLRKKPASKVFWFRIPPPPPPPNKHKRNIPKYTKKNNKNAQ